MTDTILIGAAVDSGQRRPGCLMGPAAYRVAGLARAIADLGHGVTDWGDAALPPLKAPVCANPAVDQLAETLGWTEMLAAQVQAALATGAMPIVLGGDHSLALG